MAVGRAFGRSLIVMFTIVSALHQIYDPVSAEKSLVSQVQAATKSVSPWMKVDAKLDSETARLFIYLSSALSLLAGFLVIRNVRIGAWVLLFYLLVTFLLKENELFTSVESADLPQFLVETVLHWGLIAGLSFVIGGSEIEPSKEKED